MWGDDTGEMDVLKFSEIFLYGLYWGRALGAIWTVILLAHVKKIL